MVVTGGPSHSKDASGAAGALAEAPVFDGLPWGLWQARTILLAGLCKVTTAWHMAIVLYASPPSPFGELHCSNLGQGDTNASSVSNKNNNTASGNIWPTVDTFWDWTWEPWVHCEEAGKVLEFDEAMSAPPPTECAGWLELQTVNQWSGACYRQFVGGSSQFCYLVGIALGGAVCLTLLRNHSPRRVLLAALACEAVLAFLLSGIQVFWAHVQIRFLLAISSAHVFTAAATLCIDVCMGMAKTLTTSLFEIWWALGIISIAVFGSYALNWTCLQAILSMPSFALILPCALLLPESPRWLVSRGRVEEAVHAWDRAAALNGQQALLPPRAAFTQRLEQQASAAHAQRKLECSVWSCSVGGPGRCRHVVKVLALHIMFGCITNTFFGSILNVRNWGTPGMLGLATGEAAAGVSGIVGFFIGTLIVTRCGRPLLWVGILLLVAGSIGQGAHAVEDQDGLLPRAVQVTLFALTERVAVAAALSALTTCAPQLVASQHRRSLIFSCLLFGRICLLAAPFVGNLSVFGEAFPLTAFGLELIVAGVCSSLVALISVSQSNTQKEIATKS